MRRQIIAELLAEYDQARASAEAKAALKREEIVQKAPLYGRIGSEIARIAVESIQAGQDPAPKVQALRARAKEELAKAGYSQEDLQPPYRCPLCRDTGYVETPRKRFCECFQKRLQERVVQRSGLGSAPGHTFDHFDLDVFSDEAQEGSLSQRETMRRLRRFAESYADAFPNNEKRDLTFTGPTGLGKTFLADCIAARVLERGFTVLRMTAFRLMEALRRHHMGRDEENLLDVMLTADLLLIDDLGTEPLLENVSIEYLFAILNERQQAQRATLVATNLTLPELRARYTERITSRLLNGECAAVIPFKGRDVRWRRPAQPEEGI